MRPIISLILFALFFIVPPDAVAQDRLSLEIGPAVAYATEDLGDAELGFGVGVEALLAYRIMPHVAAYGGWGWHHFGSDDGLGMGELDVEETGYTFGLRFEHPFRNRAPRIHLGAGAIYNHLELESSDGDVVEDSGHGFGWQAEAGFALDIARTWEVIPVVRFRSLTREIESDTAAVDVDLSYVTFRVGLRKTF